MKVISVQDVSRPFCKRFVAHVAVDVNNKKKVKAVIKEMTKMLKVSNTYSNETTKERFKNDDAHVVRLYVHYNKDVICQSMWVDKTAEDVTLPLPLEYNDFVDDIGIVWGGKKVL